jgi:hypothetical protein
MKELSMDLPRPALCCNVAKENLVGKYHQIKSRSAENVQEFEAFVGLAMSLNR